MRNLRDAWYRALRNPVWWICWIILGIVVSLIPIK
jgi:hypothetical protein